VVDGDAAVREALSSLLRSVGLQVKVFGSAPELFQSELPDAAGCLVLDIRLPGVSGLGFQDRLSKANIHMWTAPGLQRDLGTDFGSDRLRPDVRPV
jgi:FixJ family two-component response regulator